MSDAHIADRLEVLLAVPSRSPPAVGLLVPHVLDELRAWVDDDHQWAPGTRPRNWVSLLCDVARSFAALPYSTQTITSDTTSGALRRIDEIVEQLGRDHGRAEIHPNSPMRADLGELEIALRREISRSAVLSAAWNDLVRAVKKGGADRERVALGHLASIAELQGHAWQPLSRRLWRVLGDDATAIRLARADLAGEPAPEPTYPPERANLDPTERLRLAQRLLTHSANRSKRIVWLAYLEAFIEREAFSVGPHVKVFNGRWMYEVLEDLDHNSQVWASIPAEVVAHREECLRGWKLGGSQPFVLMRVDLGDGVTDDVEQDAEAVGEMLMRLASFFNNSRVSWQPAASYVVFADGALMWQTVGLTEPPTVDGAELRLAQDRTGEILETLEPIVAPHVLVQDWRVRDVLDLLRWLLEARGTWEPARFLLFDRILERASGWAGDANPDHFARGQLALPWAIDQLTTDLAGCIIDAVNAIDRHDHREAVEPARREAFLRARKMGLVEDWPGMRVVANIPRGLENQAWLASWQRPGTDGAIAAQQIAARAGTAAAARRSIIALEKEFNVLLSRARRTRNAIAHGGPVPPATLRTVGPFGHQLAVDALNQALHAFMSGIDLGEHLATRRRRHRQVLDDLEAGVPPQRALFWKDQPPD